MSSMIAVDDRSEYRCDHWKHFAARIQEYLAAKNDLPPTVLFFVVKESNMPAQDGRLFLVLGRGTWDIPGAVEDREGDLRAQAQVGKMFLRVSGLPDCPDTNGDSRETDAVKKLLDRLLPQVVEQDPEKLAAAIAAANEAERDRSREAYVKECSKRFEKTVEGTKKAIADGHAAVTKLQEELVKKIREARGAECKLEQLEASRGAQAEGYGQEFDKLLVVPKVMRVEAKEGKVVVYTDTLYCLDPRTGVRHEIGAFRIELDTTRGAPRWFNLTRRVDAYKSQQMAPHIWSDGDACLGNTAEVFPELIGNYEFAAAALVAIQFVESVNTDDSAGKHIIRWPLA